MNSDYSLMSPIRIYCLGQFELFVGANPLRSSRLSSHKPFELLKGLLVNHGRGVSHPMLSEWLWPEAEGGAAYRALITNVYRLRAMLGCKATVEFSDGRVALSRSLVWVDAWAFESGVDGGKTNADLTRALTLYRGHFLEDDESSLAIHARIRLRRKFSQHAVVCCRSLEARGEYREAIALSERALEIDPTEEALHRSQIACWAQLGEATAAARAYVRCRRELATRLQTLPSPATTALLRRSCGNQSVTALRVA